MFRSYDHLQVEIFVLNLGVCILLRVLDQAQRCPSNAALFQQLFTILFKLSAMSRSYDHLQVEIFVVNLGVCILLRVLDQAQRFPCNATLFQLFTILFKLSAMFRSYDHLQVEIFVVNLGVCIMLRVLDQAQRFPSNATLFQQLFTISFKLSATCFSHMTIFKWKYISEINPIYISIRLKMLVRPKHITDNLNNLII
jgi:hypothetical protein